MVTMSSLLYLVIYEQLSYAVENQQTAKRPVGVSLLSIITDSIP